MRLPVAAQMAAYPKSERDDLSTEQRYRILIAPSSLEVSNGVIKRTRISPQAT